MAAVSRSQPLCQPSLYTGTWKVELNVKKPLMPLHLSSEQVGLEMLCLCGQLDLLIRAQLQEQARRDISPRGSDFFQREAADIVELMRLCLGHLPRPVPQLEDYLDAVGLSPLYPRVEVFIINGSPVDMLEKPRMDDYFARLGKLNQLLVLSQQLGEDAKNLGSHKYIAHQLSVIYQVLSTFRGIPPLSMIRKDIEINFKQLKTALVVKEEDEEPQLPAHYISWIMDMTQSIISFVSSLPEELNHDLRHTMSFISNLT